MLKTSAVTAVILMLGLPACTLAKPAETSRPEQESQRLPFTQVRDSLNKVDGKQPCEGNSVKEFLQGTCDKLKGFDRVQDIRFQSSPGRTSIPPFYEFSPTHRMNRGTFVKDAGGHAWHIYGEEGTHNIPPFFQFTPRIYRRDGEFGKQSVDDFMQGKTDRLKGVDPIPYGLRKAPLPPAWGGDEFVDTEGFTQSGAPYQHVNPLFGIPLPQFDLRSPKEQAQPKN